MHSAGTEYKKWLFQRGCLTSGQQHKQRLHNPATVCSRTPFRPSWTEDFLEGSANLAWLNTGTRHSGIDKLNLDHLPLITWFVEGGSMTARTVSYCLFSHQISPPHILFLFRLQGWSGHLKACSQGVCWLCQHSAIQLSETLTHPWCSFGIRKQVYSCNLSTGKICGRSGLIASFDKILLQKLPKSWIFL